MALKIGIVGLPNAGKSTLFKALTANEVLVAAYPFATIEPNTGMVPVPDSRLDELSGIYKPEKTLPATVQFLDIAGLVRGAHKGEGLGNKFLAHIRQTNAICHVVRAFKSTEVAHVEEKQNPKNDIEIINTELVLADLQTLQNFISKFEKIIKADPKQQPSLDFLKKVIGHLNQNLPLRELVIEKHQTLHPQVKSLLNNLLTNKPLIYVFNIDEPALSNKSYQQQLLDLAKPHQGLCINAALESELSELETIEAKELLTTYNLEESALNKLVRLSYAALGLITFFTVGPQEVRAWTLKKGLTAPQAGSVIHADFERGFIAAEVINFHELVKFKSWQEAKVAGKIRQEGKDYLIQDGDVVVFRFNV